MTAAVTAASAAALANPLVAEAAMTPSLKNTLLSVAAGGIVLAAIGAAVLAFLSFHGPYKRLDHDRDAVAVAPAEPSRE